MTAVMPSLTAMIERSQMVDAVRRHIYCPVTGQVLDVRTAVFVYRNAEPDAQVIAAVSPEGWSTAEPTMTARFPALVARRYA